MPDPKIPKNTNISFKIPSKAAVLALKYQKQTFATGDPSLPRQPF